MSVWELTREQIIELKERHLARFAEEAGESITMYELMRADELVSDKTIFTDYVGYYFENDDFFCTAGDF